jgi:hypothetical protein
VPGLVDRLEVDGNGAFAPLVDASHVLFQGSAGLASILDSTRPGRYLFLFCVLRARGVYSETPKLVLDLRCLLSHRSLNFIPHIANLFLAVSNLPKKAYKCISTRTLPQLSI